MSPDEARHKLVDELGTVRAKFDRGDDDWEHALVRTFREYCREIGVEYRLCTPIQRLLLDIDARILRARKERDGGHPTLPPGPAAALTVAAAAITVLHERGSKVPEAAHTVARLTGLDRVKIANFRQNIHRGRATAEACKAYPRYVKEIRSWETLNTLRDLSRFVTNPPSGNT